MEDTKQRHFLESHLYVQNKNEPGTGVLCVLPSVSSTEKRLQNVKQKFWQIITTQESLRIKWTLAAAIYLVAADSLWFVERQRKHQLNYTSAPSNGRHCWERIYGKPFWARGPSSNKAPYCLHTLHTEEVVWWVTKRPIQYRPEWWP